MNHFGVSDLPLEGLKLIAKKRIGDSRGFLSRLFCSEELAAVGWHKPIKNINHTHTSQRGTVRGMHYQKSPYEEMKLVTCIRGEIWDVVVDIREGSPTFLKWHAVTLSYENNLSLLIPEGFAHGFQSLTDDVELLYFHTELHNLEAEASLNAKDPFLGLDWPEVITKMSTRDTNTSMIEKSFKGIRL